MSYSTSNSAYGRYYTSSRTPSSSIVSTYSGSSYLAGSNLTSKISSGPKGLYNLGNTCYISSVLQVLFLILDEKNLTITSKSQQKITRLFFILKNTRDRDDYKLFKEALQDRIDIVKGWDQQDAHELMIRMLDEIGKQNPMSLKKGQINLDYNEKQDFQRNWIKFVSEMTKIENNKVSGPFQGEILKQFICPYNHQKHNFQRFMDLSLSLPKKQTSSYSSYYYSSPYSKPILLTDLIYDYLGQQSIEDLQCQQCKSKRTFKKHSVIYSTPVYFIIHLSRFAKGWYDNQKDSREVEFDEILGMHQKNGNNKVSFRLLGAIHHVGTMNRGHYYAWVRMGQDWFEVNDQKVYSEQVKSKGNVSSSVYLLIYVKQKI